MGQMSAAEFVERWTSADLASEERDELLDEALDLPVLRHYTWEAPEEPDLEPGWYNEVLALYLDPEDNRRVFGFFNIQGRHGGTGLGWEQPEDLPERYEVVRDAVLRDFDLVVETNYFNEKSWE